MKKSEKIAIAADMGTKLCHQDGAHVMSLLILLSIPALSTLLCMVGAITEQTLYLRLQGRPCRVIPFPTPLHPLPRPKAS